MKVLIIEDEKRNAGRLIRLLHDYDDDIIIYGPLTSIVEIEHFFQRKIGIDLILSDIRLTDGLCFDKFNAIPETIPVIFTTAYDEYALKAFDYNGIAYLLKPIDKDELIRAIEKCKRMFLNSNTKEIAELCRIMQRKPEVYRERFLIGEKDGYIAVPVSEISFISTDSGVVRINMKKGNQYIVDMSLEDIESQLDPKLFFRATRQNIVNISSVKRIVNWFNRKIKINIIEYPDAEIIVGKEKVSRLKQWLDR